MAFISVCGINCDIIIITEKTGFYNICNCHHLRVIWQSTVGFLVQLHLPSSNLFFRGGALLYRNIKLTRCGSAWELAFKLNCFKFHSSDVYNFLNKCWYTLGSCKINIVFQTIYIYIRYIHTHTHILMNLIKASYIAAFHNIFICCSTFNIHIKSMLTVPKGR
jgi:hypothetical protein